MEKLKAAVASSDARALEHHAHKLKGSCRNIGAVRVANLCDKLEDLGAAKKFVGAPDLMAGVYAEYALAAAELLGSFKKNPE